MPGWYWPDDLPKNEPSQAAPPGSSPSQSQSQPSDSATDETPPAGQRTRSGRTHWPPRQCRICLETVQPTFNVPSQVFPGFLQSSNVVYEDDSGRLIRPCMCKGSSKYVHAGCLQQWRHADPSYGRRNYWQCPTCGFKYRLARLGVGRFIGSVGMLELRSLQISGEGNANKGHSCSSCIDSHHFGLDGLCSRILCRPNNQLIS